MDIILKRIVNIITILQEDYQKQNVAALKLGDKEVANFTHGMQGGLGEAISIINRVLEVGK